MGRDDPALTHVDADGRVVMVDGAKSPSERRAVAAGRVLLSPAAVSAIGTGSVAKGDVLTVARIAGIGGAKRTSELIPLCHPLRLTGIDVDATVVADGVERPRRSARTTAPGWRWRR